MRAAAKHLDERINMRASKEEKSLLESASELAGFRDLTTFIMTTMRRESMRLINEHGAQYLSDRDRDIILNLLASPPKPNENLRKLLKQKKSAHG